MEQHIVVRGPLKKVRDWYTSKSAVYNHGGKALAICSLSLFVCFPTRELVGGFDGCREVSTLEENDHLHQHDPRSKFVTAQHSISD